jgi:hypothetical protein
MHERKNNKWQIANMRGDWSVFFPLSSQSVSVPSALGVPSVKGCTFGTNIFLPSALGTRKRHSVHLISVKCFLSKHSVQYRHLAHFIVLTVADQF